MSTEENKQPANPRRRFLRWPVFTVDLTRPVQRLQWMLILIVAGIVLLGIAIGGGTVYNWSESPEFCGTVCHSMDPQWVRWNAGPHASVACVHCHVGPGVAGFIEAKAAGTRQLVDTITNNVAKPIKSPVINLRPARETCEECHNPASFKSNVIRVIKSYDNDSANTPVQTTLILKLGGLNPVTGDSNGIHWHIQSKITYVAMDEQRQKIAWVGVTRADGSVEQYFLRDLADMGPQAQTDFIEQAKAENNIRTMDCIDCHNRAAHYIPYPEQAVDGAISNGLISRDLPAIRAKAVALVNGGFPNNASAYTEIDKLSSAYADYALQSAGSKAAVDQAVSTIKKLYEQDNFPDMKLDWRTNPNNARHTPTLGCFRCHDDKHVYVDGAGKEHTISAQCNLCHTVPIVGRGTETLVEAPVIVGEPPATHKDFRWTVDHRNVTDAEEQECATCHGQAFCNNAVCHNLKHPQDMLFSHPQIVRSTGGQTCYTCHQNIFCSRCHPDGVINNP